MSRPATPPDVEANDRPIEVKGLSVTYGKGARSVQAIGNIDVAVHSREFLSIVGPSGCGKTTLLMCLAGLRSPTRGSVQMHGNPVTEPVQGLSIVFQNYSRSLFPWYTNAENVRLALWDSGLSKREQMEKVTEVLDWVGLEDVPNLYPWQLSGGMQQRVALARGLVTGPEVLLMDEPFASVDAQTRTTLEDVLLEVWNRARVTIVFVTHDIDEAAYLSDRVTVLSRRPSTVLRDISVDLPRPRDQIATRSSPAFAEIRTAIYELVMTPRGRKPE